MWACTRKRDAGRLHGAPADLTALHRDLEEPRLAGRRRTLPVGDGFVPVASESFATGTAVVAWPSACAVSGNCNSNELYSSIRVFRGCAPRQRRRGGRAPVRQPP